MVVDGVPNKQRAAQFHPKDQSVHINEIPIPSIKPDEMLVKIASASLCHSDLMLFEPNDQGLNLGEGDPFTMGHEGCGSVVDIGSEVKGFKEGDRIGWLPIVDCCYECEACQGQPKIQGMTVDGYFQEYCAIKWKNAAHLPDGMDLKESSPMFCAGATAYNSVMDTLSELKMEDPKSVWVAVIGCGGLGHLGVQYLSKSGVRVIGIDLSHDALEEAKAQGAEHVFNPSSDKDYVEQIRTITGKGCHAAINFTNSVQAYWDAPNVLRFNGVLMVTGIPQKPLQFQSMDISMWKVRIRGSNIGRQDQLQKCLEFSQEHGIKPHVTKFKLDQFQEMLDTMHANRHKGRMGVVFE